MKRFFWFLSIASFGFAVMLIYCPRVGVSAAPAPGPGDTFNLLSFGAVGDGTHDDGPALQAALNAIANAHGGTLIVPAGQFAIVTPVIKDFSFANSVEIRGVASTTLINTKGTGEQISHGLDLTSQFVIKTGYPNIGLQITSLRNLLISDMVFIGTPQASTDARVPLVLAGIDNAVIRHCEFYGLSSVNDGGAILYADSSSLKVDQTAFLGCTGNSAIRNSVVLLTNWRSFALTESVFVDYGTRPGFYSKLGMGTPYSWVMIANAAPADTLTPRRDALIRNVFMDEGGFMAIASIPDFYNPSAAAADSIYISDYKLNDSNLGTSAVYIDRGAQHVMVDRGAFGYSHNAGPALYLNNITDAILDKVICTESVNTIYATSTVGKLSVINTTCSNVQSQAGSTSNLTTAPDDDPVQYVRRQYLALTGVEPSPADHYSWSNLLLLCGADQNCIAQKKTDLNNSLTRPAAPSHLTWIVQGAMIWQDNSFNESGFKVERFDSGAWTQVATTAPNVTSYTVSATDFATYRVRAFNSKGDSDYSNTWCSRCSEGSGSADVRIANYGFETPAVGAGSFQYAPTGASWTFAGGAGVTGNSSGFTGGLNIAPEGSQAAFVQGGSGSTISQTVSGFQNGRSYIVTFAAAQRTNCCNAGGQDFQVYLDTTLLGTFHPSSGTYAYYATQAITTTSGPHTLKFAGLNPLGGDHTAFIDDVRVTASTGW